MNGDSVILQFEPLNPSNIAGLNSSIPFANGIMIISSEHLTGGSLNTYYGDEVDLQFWSLLRLAIGASPTPSNPMTLTPGYRYVYNHGTREFDVYDSFNNNIVHISNIIDIAQMNIDFTIMNSHKFEILASPESLGFSKFIFPAILKNDNTSSTVQNSIACGVNNKYLPDRVRPYQPSDIDNPFFNIKYLADDYFEFVRNFYWSVFDNNGPIKLEGINYYWAINFKKVIPSNYMYLAGLHVDKKVQVYDVKDLEMVSVEKILNGKLVKNMYPNLMNIVRLGETMNNRPVYEPWLMIWYGLLYNPNFEETPEFLNIFDLSPRWT